MVLPLALFLLVAVIWILVKLCRPKWVKNLARNLVISFISILFLLHPKLTEQSLGMFRCVSVDDGESRMRIDPNTVCYSREHIIL